MQIENPKTKWFSSIYWKNHNKGNDWRSLVPLTLVMTKSDLEKNYYQQFVSKLQIIKKLTWRFKRPKLRKQRVYHTVALPFTFKNVNGKISKGLWKLKYFTMQKYNLQKNHLKETKTLQDITTL